MMVIEFGVVFQLDNQISYLYEDIIHNKIKSLLEFIDKNEFLCFIDFNVQLLQFMNWKYPIMLDKLIKNLKIGKIVFINKYNFGLINEKYKLIDQIGKEINDDILNEILVIPENYSERIFEQAIDENTKNLSSEFTHIFTNYIQNMNEEEAYNDLINKLNSNKNQKIIIKIDIDNIQYDINHILKLLLRLKKEKKINISKTLNYSLLKAIIEENKYKLIQNNKELEYEYAKFDHMKNRIIKKIGEMDINTEIIKLVIHNLYVQRLSLENKLNFMRNSKIMELIINGLNNKLHILNWFEFGENDYIEYGNENLYSIWTSIGAKCVLLIDKSSDTIVCPNPYLLNFSEENKNWTHSNPIITFPKSRHQLVYGGFMFEDEITINDEYIGELSHYETIMNEIERKKIYKKQLNNAYYNTHLDVKNNLIIFECNISGINIVKKINIEGSRIKVKYNLVNMYKDIMVAKLSVNNEFSPSPLEIMNNGKNVMELNLGAQSYKINNIVSENGVKIESKIVPSGSEMIESLFGARLKLIYSNKLKQGEIFENQIELNLTNYD
tara:strand:+ start:1174 stop:2832 length:1659 start_codon:yes stop_codon:yes gene_type:complete